MLELAIAEAYRPHPRQWPHMLKTAAPRPATFATNPKASSSDSSFHSRTSSTPSRSPSVATHSRSFVSFLTRRKRPGTASSDATARPRDAARADSLFSQTTVTRATQPAEGSKKVQKSRHIPQLPVLPHPVPLPPQEELLHFDGALEFAIEDLQSTFELCLERDIAVCALEHVTYISNLASCVATGWPEFWTMLIHAVKLIASVLPAANIGARNVLVASLASVARRWNEEKGQSAVKIGIVAGEAFDEVTKKTRKVGEKLSKEFAQWLCRHYKGAEGRGARMVRILTLGVSTAVLAALRYALAEDEDIEIHLSVLSSLDQSLPPPPSYPRVHISTYLDSAVGTASQSVHALLLEPACIDSRGHLQCENGALGTAVCVRTLSPLAKIVVLSGANSIASSKMEREASTSDLRGTEGNPEALSASFVDVYITEAGELSIENLAMAAARAEGLERHILGDGD